MSLSICVYTVCMSYGQTSYSNLSERDKETMTPNRKKVSLPLFTLYDELYEVCSVCQNKERGGKMFARINGSNGSHPLSLLFCDTKNKISGTLFYSCPRTGSCIGWDPRAGKRKIWKTNGMAVLSTKHLPNNVCMYGNFRSFPLYTKDQYGRRDSIIAY